MNKRKLAAVLMPVTILLGAIFVAMIVLFAIFMLVAMPADEERDTDPFAGGTISELGEGEIPAEYIPVYEAAAAKYDVPWNLLAAVHRVETNFSTIANMESYAGAIGHFQFMPCTWVGWGHPTCTGLGRGVIPSGQLTDLEVINRYGGFGVDGDGDGKADPFSLPDAVSAAASYLGKSGASDGDFRRAVFTYNHSEKYVSDVLSYMEKYVDYQIQVPDELIAGTDGFNRPMNSPITSRYGSRLHPITGIWKMHAGIDFGCSVGDSVRASKAGVVSYSGWHIASQPKAGWGIYVWVEHGGGYKTGYAHLSTTAVKVGDKVNPGDPVGGCGNTGSSTGPHLHFELFRNGTQVDPAPYLGL